MIFYIGITLGIVITSASALVIVLLRLNASRRRQTPPEAATAANPIRKWMPKFALTGLLKKLAVRRAKKAETTAADSPPAPAVIIPGDNIAATLAAEASAEPVPETQAEPAAGEVQSEVSEPGDTTPEAPAAAGMNGEAVPEAPAAAPEEAPTDIPSLADGIEAAFAELNEEEDKASGQDLSDIFAQAAEDEGDRNQLAQSMKNVDADDLFREGSNVVSGLRELLKR